MDENGKYPRFSHTERESPVLKISVSHISGDENIFLALDQDQQSLHSTQQGAVGKRSLSGLHPL